jgi:hypothetical protein
LGLDRDENTYLGGHHVKIFRCDGGTEFINSQMKTTLTSLGIKLQTSAPYTPEQNGIAERDHRSTVESARSQIHDRGVPLSLWAEAVNYSVYVLNRTLSKTHSKTPFERWHGVVPDISNLRIFGSVAYMFIPDALRQKLDPKAVKGVYVGESEEQKASRIFVVATGRTHITRHVKVYENLPYWPATPEPPPSTSQPESTPPVINLDSPEKGVPSPTAPLCVEDPLQQRQMSVPLHDGLVERKSMDSIDDIVHYLNRKFEITAVPADHFVSIVITRDWPNKRIYLSIPQFIEKNLTNFRLSDAHPLSLPVLKGSPRLSSYSSPSTPAELPTMADIPFREVVGCIMYAALTVRIDIAFIAGQLAQHCQNPGMDHWKAAQRVLKYLASTRNHGLCFGGNVPTDKILIGYSDAYYAGDPDTRRSTFNSFSTEAPSRGLAVDNPSLHCQPCNLNILPLATRRVKQYGYDVCLVILDQLRWVPQLCVVIMKVR